MPSMPRRRFLVTLVISGFAVFFSLFVSRAIDFQSLRRRITNYKKPKLDESYPLGTLSEKEMETLLALSEILVPKDTKMALDRQFFGDFINDKTSRVGGYLKEYREGARLIEETTRVLTNRDMNFFELSLSERDKVLGSILWRYNGDEVIRPLLEGVLESKRQIAFREFVVKDILRAYYRSPSGWAVVGYSRYPGLPAVDPREYTRPLKY